MKLRQQLIDLEDVIDEKERQAKVGQYLDLIDCVNKDTVEIGLTPGPLHVVDPGCARYISVRFRKMPDGTPVAYHRVRITSIPFAELTSKDVKQCDLKFLEDFEIAGAGEDSIWVSPPEAEVEGMKKEIREQNKQVHAHLKHIDQLNRALVEAGVKKANDALLNESVEAPANIVQPAGVGFDKILDQDAGKSTDKE